MRNRRILWIFYKKATKIQSKKEKKRTSVSEEKTGSPLAGLNVEIS